MQSEKSTGKDSIRGRYDGHKKRAESQKNDDQSNFYDLYPSKISPRQSSRDGYFENLAVRIPIAFDGKATSSAFHRDIKDGGVFTYSSTERAYIESANFPGKSGHQKYMEMAAYLFETGYELCLSWKYNASESPGFEGCGMRKRAD